MPVEAVGLMPVLFKGENQIASNLVSLFQIVGG